MATGQPRGPFRLVTVNNAPERAKLVIGQVSDALKDRYIIEHAGNCDGKQNACGIGFLCTKTNWKYRSQPSRVES